MKKVKIMLMSIAVLAIVGGALAFKAKFESPICVMPTENFTCPLTQACPELFGLTTTDIAVDDLVCTGDAALAEEGFCDPADCQEITYTDIDDK